MDTAPALIADASAELAATGPGFWVVACGAALLLLAGSSLRVVPDEERLVVFRFGRVVRVRGPGLVLRLPGVERLLVVSMGPAQIPLVVHATTSDGVPVRLLGTGVCRVTDPSRAAETSPDPLTVTANALEDGLAEEVARADLNALLASRERFEARLPGEVTARTAIWGAEVVKVEVSDIETWLTADLLDRVRGNTKAGDR